MMRMRRIIAAHGPAGAPGIGKKARLLSCNQSTRPVCGGGTEMLEIRNLRKKFGSLVAVDDVSFTVARGEVLGFLGPNGAGKSTTMKMATVFLAPDRGTAIICGHDIAEHPLAAKRQFGYLPEGAPAYPDMTVGD